ncbi:MAG: TlpA disulfide reductase family protein [Myxococcota bacterium]|nr:TlpA disulfide reductase family protein [Myxococcota bacterium]
MNRACLPAVLAALAAPPACGAAHGAAFGPAPDFTGRTVDGATFRLGDHLGRSVVVLAFWTSVCASCKTELAHLQELHEELSDRGLLVVAVSMDDAVTVGNVRTVRDRLGFTFPVVLDEDSTIAGLYNPRAATPFTVILDGRGRRAWSREGFTPGDSPESEARIRSLLADLESRATATPRNDGPP